MCKLQTDDLFIFSIVRINSKTSHPCSSSSSMGTQSFKATFRGREVGTPLADSFPQGTCQKLLSGFYAENHFSKNPQRKWGVPRPLLNHVINSVQGVFHSAMLPPYLLVFCTFFSFLRKLRRPCKSKTFSPFFKKGQLEEIIKLGLGLLRVVPKKVSIKLDQKSVHILCAR